MNFIDLEAFVSVVDHGSIVAAAAHLHLTQSAVTRRVQNLETVLGVPLLDRQTRPMRPLPAGAETYEFAREVLTSIGDLQAAIMHNGEPSGAFRFGMSRGLGDLAIASPIRCLRRDLPKVELHAFVQWSFVLLERLQNHTLDAAVVILPECTSPPVSAVAEHLGTKPLHVVAGRTWTVGDKVSLKELSDSPWILNPHGCASRQLLEGAMFQRGLPFRSTVEAEGHELQFSLIQEGIGLGITLPDVLNTSSFKKNIKVLEVTDFLPRQSIWLVYSKHIGSMAPAVHCLKGAVQQFLTFPAT